MLMQGHYPINPFSGPYFADDGSQTPTNSSISMSLVPVLPYFPIPSSHIRHPAHTLPANQPLFKHSREHSHMFPAFLPLGAAPGPFLNTPSRLPQSMRRFRAPIPNNSTISSTDVEIGSSRTDNSHGVTIPPPMAENLNLDPHNTTRYAPRTSSSATTSQLLDFELRQKKILLAENERLRLMLREADKRLQHIHR
ncbi:hypothetical protein Ciccas_005723, partial [Cichlidogyrus casuarinus]